MMHLSHRKTATLVLTLLVVLAPLLLAGVYVMRKHQWAETQLAEMEPRYARLLGLEASRDELQQAEVKAAALLAEHAYSARLDVSQTGNDAQQRIRQIFTRAGLEILSSQVLPPKTEKQFDRIALTVRSEGELLALQSALVILASQKPSIFIDELTVQSIGTGRGGDRPQRLSTQFRLSVVRANS